MNKKTILPILWSVCLLLSCSNTTSISAVVKIEGNEGKIYSPNDVEISETLHSFNDKEYLNYQVMPSVGEIDIVVVPLLIPTYETIDINNDGVDDKETVREHIQTAFFGEDEENINFKSVKQFYRESSYDKLHIDGVVTPWVDLKEYGYSSPSEVTYNETINILNDIVDYLNNSLAYDMTNYDVDKDGYIDGIWVIYSAPNYTNGGPKLDDNNYWAYTSWVNTETQGDPTNPIANLFGWASYDFMYTYYTNQVDDELKIDSHTYIHETGHFLGLEDYYGENGYNPIGGADMMDESIIDHNSYSKMLLGWTKPYLVYGEGEIKIGSMSKENNLIVVLDDEAVDNNGIFNPFDEYILIELYSTEGLNYLDSLSPLDDNDGYFAPGKVGVRIYHVDKRIFVADASKYYWEIYPYNNQDINTNMGLATPITNSRSKDIYEVYFGLDSTITLYDEIRLIEASGEDTFSSGGLQNVNTFFTEGDTFSLSSYASQFYGGALNSKNPFTKTITVEAIYE